MLRPLVPLAALALAAAASAQTVVLSPVAKSGYIDDGRPTGRPPYGKLQTFLETHRHEIRTTGTGNYSLTRYFRCWMAEFRLPSPPAGMSVASATFSAKVLVNPNPFIHFTQPASASVYEGDGKVAIADVSAKALSWSGGRAAPGPFRVEVTTGVRSLLDQGKPYVGLRIAREGLSAILLEVLEWSSPSLTLVYGYPVRAPIALDGFYGDPTKIPVAYEVRRPGTREVVASASVYPDASGAIFPVAPPGTWDVSIKASHWLRKTLKGVTVVDGPSSCRPPSWSTAT